MFLIQRSKSSSIKFIADATLLTMGVSLWVLSLIICLFVIVDSLNSFDVITALIFFVMAVMLSCCCLFLLTKWRIIVELNSEGISYKPTFKKKIVKKYSDFGYFYCASYTYYTQKKYIVFSQRRLNDYELTHINNVQVSDKLIKIKVRKGLKEEISPLLPPKYLSRIPKDFW